MKKTTAISRICYVMIFAFVLCAANSNDALATNYDYGDATGYGTARHQDASWQRLGTAWDSESSAKVVDTSDDGVFWSVDNGATWGHAKISAGQTVKFRFDMYKEMWGRHNFDAIKVWIDLNGDKDFADAGENIFTNQWNFKTETGGYTPYAYGDGLARISKSFYTDVVMPTSTNLSDYWLRAQVVCNADISSNLNNLTATGSWYQGEVEDWKLTVAPVPEPGTMMLLGIGLGGLAIFGKRRMKKEA